MNISLNIWKLLLDAIGSFFALNMLFLTEFDLEPISDFIDIGNFLALFGLEIIL